MKQRQFFAGVGLCVVALIGCDDAGGVADLEPQMVLDPQPADFGDVQIGTEQQLRVQIQNPGTATLRLDTLAFVEPYDTAVWSFTIEEMEVPPGDTGFLTVSFKPNQLGPSLSILKITPKDTDLAAQDLEVKGNGVTAQIGIDPTKLDFGNVVLETTKNESVTITNSSDVEADIEYRAGDNVKFCGGMVADSSVFCVTPTSKPLDAQSRFRLSPGETTKFNVGFTPTIAGRREVGSFFFKACGTCTEQKIELEGVGIESGFMCDPATVDFGQVNPGSCLNKTTTCENVANEQITVVNWSLQNSSSEFSVAPFPGARVLQEGDTIDVEATYCPTALGADQGLLSIETDHNDPSRRFANVPLTGTGGGPDIDVLPLVVNFGKVSLIAPSRRTIQVTNVGFSKLTVSEILVDTQGTGVFTGDPTGFEVDVGQFHDITIEFQPTSEGPISSEVIIKSDDQDEPEVTIMVQGEGVNLPPCSFEIVPPSLSFGVVERARVASRAFEIRNTGSNDCLLTSARMVPGSDVEFSLPDGDVSSVFIPAGSAETIRVQYAPVANTTNTGNVEFSISSPTNPFNTVSLNGTGADATLLIVPNDLAFGVIGVGCRARARTVTVYNTGSTPAVINSIDLAQPQSPAFSIESLPAPLPGSPLTLAPGASTQFDVGFHADAVSSYAGAVEIIGSFNGQPVTYLVSLQGRGDTDAVQIDEFDQLGRPKVDILMVIDDSCSMYEEQTSLGSNFQAFIQFAQAQQLDYQIAVVTTDIDDTTNAAGRFQGTTRIVNPSTQPSPESVFADNVNVGTDGSATEEGLQAAYLALSNPLIFGYNNGFLRQDAVLSIIFVSDEPDQSPGTVDFFINFFLSIKGFRNTNLFSASSIVGDNPGGCNGGGGSASAGPRYIEAANRTGGIFQSICTSDWARALEDLSTTAFGFKSRFFLQNQPVISTVKVFVDGMEVPATSMQGTANWSYDFATNSINFTPFATPEPGAHIRVEYAVECL